jgi:hypothetical protein
VTRTKNNPRPRVARKRDKGSLAARRDRSALVEGIASTSPIWPTSPEIREAGLALIQAGADLGDGEAAAGKADADVETARLDLVAARIAWDERFNVYASRVELFARTPEDVGALGVGVLEETAHALAPPLGLDVRYDREAGLLRIAVKCPPGRRKCRIEMGPSPGAPESFKEILGDGASRALAGVAPGHHAVRAAMVDGTGQSDFCAPVFVTVP